MRETKKDIVNEIIERVKWCRENNKSKQCAEELERQGQGAYTSIELLTRSLGYKTKAMLNTIRESLSELTSVEAEVAVEEVKAEEVTVEAEAKAFVKSLVTLSLEEAVEGCKEVLNKLDAVIANTKDDEERYKLRDIENHIKWVYASISEKIEEEEAEVEAVVEPEKKPRMSAFEKWIRTFIEEKGLDPDWLFSVEHKGNTHYVDLAFLVDVMVKASKHEQEQIKNKVVYIDFKDGDVLDFFDFLAGAYIKTNY